MVLSSDYSCVFNFFGTVSGAALLSDFIVALVDSEIIGVDDEDSVEPPVVEFFPYSDGFLNRVRPLLERLQDVILPEENKHG